MLNTMLAVWKILRHAPAVLSFVATIIDYIGSDAFQKILADFLGLLSSATEKSIDGVPIPPKSDTARRRLRDLMLRRFAANVYQLPESELDACVAKYNQRQQNSELAKQISQNDHNEIV